MHILVLIFVLVGLYRTVKNMPHPSWWRALRCFLFIDLVISFCMEYYATMDIEGEDEW